MEYIYILVGLVLLVGAFFLATRQKAPSPTWKDLGQPRGRTRAEPEAHLHIKVTRADGRVEEFGHNPLSPGD